MADIVRSESEKALNSFSIPKSLGIDKHRFKARQAN
jgi:hypothetical protein